MRAANRARAQHHLAPGRSGDKGAARIDKCDAGCGTVLNLDFSDKRLGDHGQIAAATNRRQKGGCGAAALAIVGASVKRGEAFLTITADILALGIASLFASLLEGVIDRIVRFWAVNLHRSITAAIIATATIIAFHPLEIGKHIGIAPALTPGLTPALKIQGMSPNEHHSIDRRGPTKGFTTIMLQ